MRQELVQVKKQLTFEELNPLWSKIIHTLPNTTQSKFRVGNTIIDICDAKRCIVGEGRKFTNGYFWEGNDDYCRTCTTKSQRFAYLLQETPSVRMRLIGSYVNHMNLKHT